MRRAVKRATELAERGETNLVLELPTGYGKTTTGPLLYKSYRKAGLCWKAIHVLPLRAIVEKALRDFTKEPEYSDIEFAYQDGDVLLTRDGYKKDPFFASEYVLTTVDSFIHNLFKAPVTELHKLVEGKPVHYHIPFAYIYPSCVFIDEAHVAAQDERGKAVAALKAAVKILREADVPIVVMSATMGRWKSVVFKGFKFVALGHEDAEEGGVTTIHDEEFECEMKNVKYTVRKIEERQVLDIARQRLKEGKRVLIVINNVKKAVMWAKALGTAVIHSMLTRRDRAVAMRILEGAKEEPFILVGTSAIEAGVNVTFDVLISSTDAPESVVQRVGRICRYGPPCGSDRVCNGELYFFGRGAKSYLAVKEWRLPYVAGSYAPLLRDSVKDDAGLYALLLRLASQIYVHPKTLRNVFKETSYSFVRGALIETCVDAKADLEGCFTVSLDKLKKMRIEKFVVDGKEVEKPESYEKKELARWLEHIVAKYGEFPTAVLKKYEPGYGPG
jgi:CRISPR-associated endonuclease/helicase Cas3